MVTIENKSEKYKIIIHFSILSFRINFNLIDEIRVDRASVSYSITCMRKVTADASNFFLTFFPFFLRPDFFYKEVCTIGFVTLQTYKLK